MTGQTHEEVKMQRTKDEILHTIATSKCEWPGCPEAHDTDARLLILLSLPDGRKKPVPGKAAKGRFCVYHGHLASRLCAFSVTDENSDTGQLMGPMEAIYTTEQIILAQQAWRDTHPGELLPIVIPGEPEAPIETPAPVSPGSPEDGGGAQ